MLQTLLHIEFISNQSLDNIEIQSYFDNMFNNCVDPIFQSINLQPQVQFQSFYWTNSQHHNGPGRPIYHPIIDVDMQHDTLEECIADYIKPIHNHIDLNPNVTDINTRIKNVWKTNCYLSLPNILIFRLKRWQ